MAQNSLLDFLQGASNAAASNISAPVDGIAWLLRKAGIPVPDAPIGGSDWMARKGLTVQPQNQLAGLLGESVGGVAPIVAAASKAKGLLAAADAISPSTNSARSAKISPGLPTPNAAPRSFPDDYKTIPAGAVEGSRLTTSIDGVPLTAPIIVGRQTVGGMDQAAEAGAILNAARVLGAAPRMVPAKELAKNTAGKYRTEYSNNGRYQGRDIAVLETLAPEEASRVVAHEFGHLLDDIIAGNAGISAKGTSKELERLYSDLNKKGYNGGRPWDPMADGYKGDDVLREKWAEAFRAYQENPNYIKTVAPTVARVIRERVNTHPEISKVLQFNTLAPAGMAGVLGAGLLATDEQN